ncbi:UDP-N-acetylmuramoyl-tripeptide--D-alanyl-D-alanine ligase [Carnobacteriaceae bacterium zg-ZUI78]|nr:UDP-N-acetylmuramoyl-tripeptide--D-alanyl-D-alanine ligase [Carnobacteriaceae bacterium zg-ZUI78]
MREMTIVEIVKAVRAIDYTSSNRFAPVTNVQFNTSLCKTGSLFVPLRGNSDGHDYVEKAIEQGATVTFWDRSQDEAPEGIACIFVDDTLQAFHDLASYYLETTQMKVVAITGSNGKTTTKDMVAAILETTYSVYKTQGNYNNEIGVPKTILDAPEQTDILVLEMGMDGFGQIEQLSTLAKPMLAVITLIGDSHLEFLGSREGIAKAKLEMTAGLRDKGILIVPADEPLLQNKYPFTQTFGEQKDAFLCIENISTNQYGTHFTLKNSDQSIQLKIIGKYNAKNAAAAILVGNFFQVPMETQIQALATFTLTANRTEWVDGIYHTTLLNDAYNASPTSMKAILKDFQTLSVSGRKIAVLGDMRELGQESDILHASIASVIDEHHLDCLYLFGEHMRALKEVLSTKQIPVFYEKDNHDAFIQLLKNTLQEKDTILIKSSFGTNLLSVVEALKNPNN